MTQEEEESSPAAASSGGGDGDGDIMSTIESSVVDNVASDWYMFLFRGLLVSGFGLFFVCYPGDSITVLANVFGSLFIIEGLLAFIRLVVSCCILTVYREMACQYLFMFLIETTIGGLILSYPEDTAYLILELIAIWFIAIGVLQLCFACILVGYDGRFPLGFMGILYMAFGIILIQNYESSTEIIIRVIGAVLLLFGIQLLIMAKRFRDAVNDINSTIEKRTSSSQGFSTQALLNEGERGEGGNDGNDKEDNGTALSEYV